MVSPIAQMLRTELLAMAERTYCDIDGCICEIVGCRGLVGRPLPQTSVGRISVNRHTGISLTRCHDVIAVRVL